MAQSVKSQDQQETSKMGHGVESIEGKRHERRNQSRTQRSQPRSIERRIYLVAQQVTKLIFRDVYESFLVLYLSL